MTGCSHILPPRGMGAACYSHKAVLYFGSMRRANQTITISPGNPITGNRGDRSILLQNRWICEDKMQQR
jgi:hypothetical protein